MKKLLLALVALFTLTTSVQAMSYEQARERALFLTDKMAYELNLTDDQYEAAYEVNLDYLMSINSYDELYGAYWRQRNLDLSYILLDWQYRTYCAASYFYRPLYWEAGCWHFGIYARYPHRTYFYFGHPHFYTVYRGGHSWRTNGGRSWYHGKTFGGPRPDTGKRFGMKDGFERGDYGHGFNGNKPARPNGNTPNRTGFGSNTNRPANGNVRPGNGNSQQNNSNIRPANRTFGNRTFGNRTFGNNNRESSTRFTGTQQSTNSGSGTRPSGNSSSTPSRRFGGNNTSGYGTSNGNTTPNRSFGGGSSSPSRSFSGGNSSPSRSFGGGNSSTRTSGGSNNGGNHFGGRR